MFTLTIQIASVDELESFVASLKHSAPPSVVVEVQHAVQGQAAAPTTGEPDTKRGRGRPRKTESAAPAAPALNGTSGDQTSAPSVPKDEPAQQTLTQDDARAALQSLVTTKGMDEGFAVLGRFGAARVSDIKPDDFAKFVGVCQAQATA